MCSFGGSDTSFICSSKVIRHMTFTSQVTGSKTYLLLPWAKKADFKPRTMQRVWKHSKHSFLFLPSCHNESWESTNILLREAQSGYDPWGCGPMTEPNIGIMTPLNKTSCYSCRKLSLAMMLIFLAQSNNDHEAWKSCTWFNSGGIK